MVYNLQLLVYILQIKSLHPSLPVFELLTKYQSPHMIAGGDFNMVANPTLDLSTYTTHSKFFPKSASTIDSKIFN